MIACFISDAQITKIILIYIYDFPVPCTFEFPLINN